MDVGLAGGGLTGPLAAVYLARRGHRVTIYERRPDPRLSGAAAGRSINLALSVRGIDALRRVGLDTRIMHCALPMRGRTLHDDDGTTSFQAYSADGTKAIYSVSRGALNEELLTAAEGCPGVTIRFAHPVIEASTTDEAATLRLAAPDGERTATHDVVLGTDGAFSAVRERIVHSSRTDYHQDALPWGYKELTIPSRDGDFALDPGSLHIWPRRHSMMIALPNPDRSFTATLFWPYDGPNGFAGLDSDGAIVDRMRRDYPDTVPLMPGLAGEFRANPVGSLVTVRMWPWASGRLALLGDAAHAIVPFFGQGMNCSFEDVVELDRCLDETGDDVVAGAARTAARRKPNADAIAQMALENFVEMRDRAGSRWFQLAKRAEYRLERLAPARFASQYELVSFTTVPYAEALQRGERRRRAVAAAVAGLDRATETIARATRTVAP